MALAKRALPGAVRTPGALFDPSDIRHIGQSLDVRQQPEQCIVHRLPAVLGHADEVAVVFQVLLRRVIDANNSSKVCATPPELVKVLELVPLLGLGVEV